jgi:hypothetical protein
MNTVHRLVLVATLVVAVAVSAVTGEQSDLLKDAAALGRTQDDAMLEAFHKSYSLSASGMVDRAEIVTEFRRAVVIVREQVMQQGDFQFGGAALAKALLPSKGLVTFIVQVRLHPMHNFAKEPPYDLYIGTGPQSAPIASAGVKREAVFAQGGGPGTAAMVAVKLEASFPRAEVTRTARPQLIVTNDKAEILWQAHLDLSRYR